MIHYEAATPDVYVADNSALRLDLDNEPQPDACVWVEEGNAYVSEGDYLEGAPELLVEIAASIASLDLYDKLQAYCHNGVQEYLVLLSEKQEIRWYTWRSGETEQLQPNEAGILHSQVLPGLWLNPEWFWVGDFTGFCKPCKPGCRSQNMRNLWRR